MAEILYIDILTNICEWLSNTDKINLLSSTLSTHKYKNKIYYNDDTWLDKIDKLWYYNNFTSIMCNHSYNRIFPKHIRKLHYDGLFDNENTINKNTINKYTVPNSVTHLTFGYYFNQNINDCIPNSVTHLTFGDWFNQDIRGCIPDSVTHLTFGNNFNQNIRDCIPGSVTHLTFGDEFNQNIHDCIPDSVTHLTFGERFNQDIHNSIPNSVTHLTFGCYFNQNIHNNIPNSVTHLTFGFCFKQDIRGYVFDNITHLIWITPCYLDTRNFPNLVKLIVNHIYLENIYLPKPCRLSINGSQIEFIFEYSLKNKFMNK